MMRYLDDMQCYVKFVDTAHALFTAAFALHVIRAYSDFRLNATVIKVKSVSLLPRCVMDCVPEPCCRSINYNLHALENGKNCEMLHDVVNTSEKLLQENTSYHYVELIDPKKEYNDSCLSKLWEENIRDIDECLDNSTNTCDPNANCTNTKGSYVCQCKVAYSGDGKNCTDIDECLGKSNNTCDPNANCTNAEGSYVCQCKVGYSGDGMNCSVIDNDLDSTILSSEPLNFAKKLREWLPITGKWRACWRATRDSWNVETTFHSNCDDKKPTLTIVKVDKQGKNYTFGGYANESWDGNGYTSAPGSFLFSPRNKDNFPPFKALLKNKNDGQAIYRDSYYGPSFGENDLRIENNAYSNAHSRTNFGKTYQAPSGYNYGSTETRSLLAGSYSFTPSEVEVLYFLV